MADSTGRLDLLDGNAGGISAGDLTNIGNGQDTSSDEDLMSNPGTPFDKLLEVRGISREDAVALLVDDDDGIRECVPDLLMLGFNVRVITAVNGKKGLGLLETNLGNVCFVLSDTDMPVMRGPEMLHAAKEKGFLHNVPAIISTGNVYKNADEICDVVDSGLANTCVFKPFEKPNELVDAINFACLQVLKKMENKLREKTEDLCKLDLAV